MKRRVVITGAGLTSPLGSNWDDVLAALLAGEHGIVTMPEWATIGQLTTRLAGRVRGFDSAHFPRKRTRTMGRVGLLSLFASDQAIASAGIDESQLSNPRTGIAYGSTHGSSTEQETFCRSLFQSGSLAGLQGSAYLKFMSHTCVANLAQNYGIIGRSIPAVAACASASMAIGAGYEAIAYGMQDTMICGGAEELHFVHAGVFDIVYAASSHFNENPELSPRPFDSRRDGLVVAEGAGTLILEEYEHARARGAKVLGEILGYGTSCDGTHVTSPSSDGMQQAMRLALSDAQLAPSQIDYINAHATATEVGDIAESVATYGLFGDGVPISSTKGHTGHTLGGCGAIEAIFCLMGLARGFYVGTRNLETVDPRCAPLNFARPGIHEASLRAVMTNNFAFGGINTSLILGRV